MCICDLIFGDCVFKRNNNLLSAQIMCDILGKIDVMMFLLQFCFCGFLSIGATSKFDNEPGEFFKSFFLKLISLCT